MTAYRGTYEHTLDDRGRVAVPARYRQAFAEGGAVLTPGLDGCIELWTEEGFRERVSQQAKEPDTTRGGRRSRRLFNAEAQDTELDRQGRILVPARFRQMAGLDGAVVITGRLECLEIWNPQRWADELQAARDAHSGEQGPGG